MSELLSGWGEIALYLRVSEVTAWRYSKSRGLPVKYDPAGHPFITRDEVEMWKLKKDHAVEIQ